MMSHRLDAGNLYIKGTSNERSTSLNMMPSMVEEEFNVADMRARQTTTDR